MNAKLSLSIAIAGAAALAATAHSVESPIPVLIVPDLRQDEKPVQIEQKEEILKDNGLCRIVRTSFVFTNPNARQMSADLEFPLPEGATVCGYALEIDGVMIPGAVTAKEKARVAFESEKAVRVDPGVVEHVKGNIWKTRIFPLLPNKPRRAQVDCITTIEDGGELLCFETDGEDVYEGVRLDTGPAAVSRSGKVAAFAQGAILWDASTSAQTASQGWLELLKQNLPANGNWTLAVFRNKLDERAAFTVKDELVKAIESLVYDGGTCLNIAPMLQSIAGKEAHALPVLLFTDEVDTFGADPDYEALGNVFIASRPDAAPRRVAVRKLPPGEKLPEGKDAAKDTLLATLWAADRIKLLSAQADNRQEEFLALGRKYGVASPVTSLIVLENLDQYVKHDIEPHPALVFHDEWVRRHNAKDAQIEKRMADAEHERDLLALWQERVTWWNDPVPKKATPKSGLFDTVARVFSGIDDEDGAAASGAAPRAARARNSVSAASDAMVGSTRSAEARFLAEEVCEAPAAEPGEALAKSASPDSSQAGGGGAVIKITKWNPKAPYLDAIAKADNHYGAYLQEKKTNGNAPAFFMDAAGWFFANGEKDLGARILTNMAELKLENAAVWRSMGWRLREAGVYPEAIACFRKALKLRNEEGQSRRDLATVLSEYGKSSRDIAALNEALALLKDAAFTNWARRSSRRSNDRQVSIVALEELNALLSWCKESNLDVVHPQMDEAYRRDLPLKIRIVLSWDADETDLDLHVLEPNGEEAFYSHRRTSTGGFVSEDVTTGYGPEEYLRKEGKGLFRVLAHYYASHQTDLTGAATATATVYTDWGTAAEKMQILTLRLDKPKEKLPIGEIKID